MSCGFLLSVLRILADEQLTSPVSVCTLHRSPHFLPSLCAVSCTKRTCCGSRGLGHPPHQQRRTAAVQGPQMATGRCLTRRMPAHPMQQSRSMQHRR